MVMPQKSYADGNVTESYADGDVTDGDATEELCRWKCHRRAMQMVMSQKSFADGDVTEELCRW